MFVPFRAAVRAWAGVPFRAASDRENAGFPANPDFRGFLATAAASKAGRIAESGGRGNPGARSRYNQNGSAVDQAMQASLDPRRRALPWQRPRLSRLGNCVSEPTGPAGGPVFKPSAPEGAGVPKPCDSFGQRSNQEMPADRTSQIDAISPVPRVPAGDDRVPRNRFRARWRARSRMPPPPVARIAPAHARARPSRAGSR